MHDRHQLRRGRSIVIPQVVGYLLKRPKNTSSLSVERDHAIRVLVPARTIDTNKVRMWVAGCYKSDTPIHIHRDTAPNIATVVIVRTFDGVLQRIELPETGSSNDIKCINHILVGGHDNVFVDGWRHCTQESRFARSFR